MVFSIHEIQEATSGRFLNSTIHDYYTIKNLVYDTRKITFPESSIFVALRGIRSDGHQYLHQAYSKGIRNFLVSETIDVKSYPDANFIDCKNTLEALQKWAISHRRSLQGPVVAITGSNGKTITKEWLAQALSAKYQVGKSPLSFNSQIGVPISVLGISTSHEQIIIEAGISKQNEMAVLQKIVKPTLGIFTNLGDAHSLGFESKQQKLSEKLRLFSDCKRIIYCYDQPLVREAMSKYSCNEKISWGSNEAAAVRILMTTTKEDKTKLSLQYGEVTLEVLVPFAQKEMSENAMHVITYLLVDGWTEDEIQKAVLEFSTLPNRLELKQGINDCLLINDSYSSDLTSMRLALEQLSSQGRHKEKVLIMSSMDHVSPENDLSYELSKLINDKGIQKIFAIGMAADSLRTEAEIHYYDTTEDCMLDPKLSMLRHATILIKGARKFQLERIFNILSLQVHQTRLETDLSAIRHNLNYYRSLLKPATKIMAVVKAEAYGSGSIQMVKFLEQQHLDYLGVALIDEAVQLRKNGCRIPIMVFNIQEGNLSQLWEYNLEPEVYNFSILEKISTIAGHRSRPLKIHVKVDSGMHRLGFMPDEIPKLSEDLKNNPWLKVTSIFSHLSASESKAYDNFTSEQLENYEIQFQNLSSLLEEKSGTVAPFKHILNTAGIIRHTEYQYDLVRLGLGLYGIDTTNEKSAELMPAHTLKSKVLQIKPLAKGHSTGYSRSGQTDEDTNIAIISIGYADGLMRQAGNGNHQVLINGTAYPTLGNICMDVTIVDLGLDHGVKEGDDVVIFGPDNPVEKLAIACQTISYEIISRMSPRVKRTYIYS